MDTTISNLKRLAAQGDPQAEAALKVAEARALDPRTQITGRLLSIEAIERFALAGNATITLENATSGARFTYKLTRKKGDAETANTRPIFVKLMTGSDNESSYTYLGTVWTNGERPTYTFGSKSPLSPNAPGPKGMAWLMAKIAQREELPDVMIAHHEGRCGKCGRKLTVPESIESGIGPECAGRAAAKRKARAAAKAEAVTAE